MDNNEKNLKEFNFEEVDGVLAMEQITKIEKVTPEETEQLLANTSISRSIEDLIKEGVLEKVIDKVALEPRAVAASAAGYFAYSPHSSKNNVYSASSGGSVIGALYPKECYTVMSNGASRDYIKFVDSSGNFRYGYVNAAHGYWKDRFYREGNTKDIMGSNFSAKFYRVMRNTTVYSGDLSRKFVAYAGNWIICKSGYQGKSGATQHHLMLCHGIRYNPEAGIREKDELLLNLNYWNGSIGFVDTGITNAGPTTPRVRGNW